MSTEIATVPLTGLMAKFASRFGVDPTKMAGTLKATVFKVPKKRDDKEARVVSNEELMALLVVADQYGLNPFTKEIYAFSDKQGGIVPVVGVDGWVRIMNEHPRFDGIDFRMAERMVVMQQDTIVQTNKDGEETGRIVNDLCRPAPEWCEAVISIIGRTRPIVIREYLDEVYRPATKGQYGWMTGPWQSHTKRMLRHKALIQAVRVAFGFANIHDEDEAGEIIEASYQREDVAEDVRSLATADGKANASAKLDAAVAGKGGKGKKAAASSAPPPAETKPAADPAPAEEQAADDAGAEDGADAGGFSGEFEEVDPETGEVLTSAPIPPAGAGKSTIAWDN